MRKILLFMMVMLITLFFASPVRAVIIDGKDWRQPSEIASLSWYDLDVIYDVNTGLLDTAETTIDGIDFDGWAWASQQEVADMFSTFDGVSIGVFPQPSTASEQDSEWAPLMLETFTPQVVLADQSIVRGWTRTEVTETGAFVASVVDYIPGHFTGDGATVGSQWQKQSAYDWNGAWMVANSQSHAVDQTPVPEPTTIALLGIGLIGLAGAEVRRRRKNQSS